MGYYITLFLGIALEIVQPQNINTNLYSPHHNILRIQSWSILCVMFSLELDLFICLVTFLFVMNKGLIWNCPFGSLKIKSQWSSWLESCIYLLRKCDLACYAFRDYWIVAIFSIQKPQLMDLFPMIYDDSYYMQSPLNVSILLT